MENRRRKCQKSVNFGLNSTGQWPSRVKPYFYSQYLHDNYTYNARNREPDDRCEQLYSRSEPPRASQYIRNPNYDKTDREVHCLDLFTRFDCPRRLPETDRTRDDIVLNEEHKYSRVII